MPLMFLAMLWLFLHRQSPGYWLVAIPLLLLFGFMNTLADVHDLGNVLRIKRWWNSVDLPKGEITGISPSFIGGIGVLHLRQFAFPWGRIYFVEEWSNLESVDTRSEKAASPEETAAGPRVRDSLASLALAVSGYICARAISNSVREFRIETYFARSAALTIAAALCILFAATRTKKPSFANVVLFVATWISGLVHW